jgi:tRNA dimethylallyltransferase
VQRAILLMGPTAAGKSELAAALVERLPLEIVSVDSALVYRGMDIGTAKPDAELRQRVPHWLIDIRDPSERFSAGEFLREAAAAMQSIESRDRIPLLVGGTMLYFHALTEGLAELPSADPDVRARIDAEAQVRGWASLHAQLAAIDPSAAARIHPNDPQRIQRALEVHQLTGNTLTELQARPPSPLSRHAVLEIAIHPEERRFLHERIERRFMAMMAAGFLREVVELRARGDLSPRMPSMRAVGYRQIWGHLEGACSLEEAVRLAIVATRQLAKRQLTWLRARPRAERFGAEIEPVAARIAAWLGGPVW